MSTYRTGTLIASGSRTTTQTLDPLTLAQAGDRAFHGMLFPEGGTVPRLLEVTIDLTAFTTTASLTPSIEVYDEAKGGFVAVLTGAAIAATSSVVLRYGIPITPVANLAAQGLPTHRWRVVVTHGNANAHTYSVSARVLSQ